MSKNEKNARAKVSPALGKSVKTAVDPDDYWKQTPAWRISKLQKNDPYGWHTLTIQDVHSIQEKLLSFESMTWSEILVKGKKFNHLVEVAKLCRPAQDSLVSMAIEDIDEILSLRLGGKERVWGILDRGIVELLWWDPKHEICPSELKHT